MSPFLANLMAGGILALIGWCILFGIWVVRENSSRKQEVNDVRLEIAKMRGDFVSQQAWNEFNRNFDTWKAQILEKIGHLGELIAAQTGKTTR